jgi:phosphate transport system substrate-binding protein
VVAITVTGEERHEEFAPSGALSGTLSAAGSDTMLQLQTLMAEAFARHHPDVAVQVEGKGSATAPTALLESTIQIANMSRGIASGEAEAFEDRFGYEPIRVNVALDAIAVYVHRDNPVPDFTLQQLDAVFSSQRRCGAPQDLVEWGQFGLVGDWAGAPISLYGRNAVSGTAALFRERVLCRGAFKAVVKEQPGSASVVQGIENDRYGLGYAGIGYATAGVRAVPLASAEGESPVLPTAEHAATNRYPLARFLQVYANKAPGQPLDQLTHEYLRFMLSAEGQAVVEQAGFFALRPAMADRELARLSR